MRRALCGWILACAALLAAIAAAPAHAITNVYSLQASVTAGGGTLAQYTVGPGGALAPSPPDTALAFGPTDIAVTPDGRFAYVMTNSATAGATIVSFARTASGRLEQNGPVVGPLFSVARGIIVNPQGTRVYYGHPASAIFWRAINPDGTLGGPNQITIAGSAPIPWARSLAMTPDGTSLYAADFFPGLGVRVWQLSIDPATGAGATKGPAEVPFPVAAGAGGPADVGRMAISPSGSHLYLAADTPGVGIARWAIDPATGLLGGGTQEPPGADGYSEAVVALSTSGATLWAPSGNDATAPERIRQFSVAANGALAPLAPATVDYVVANPARDAVATPDGASLYLGQNGVVSEWSVGGGAVIPRSTAQAVPESGLVNAGIALSPSQAPVAAFAALPARAGSASLFDARASADPDGAITRYDWDFGDGTSAPNGAPIVAHVYATPGTRTVTLTVTDADGTSTEKLWTGTRMLRNGGPSARTTRGVTIAAAVAPRPRKGRSVTVVAVSGKILVRVPGSGRYVPVGELTEIPLGSIVDARKGKARITAEVNAKTHKTQSSVFYDWYFKILQTKGSKPITEARLTKGSFASCTPSRLSRSGFATKSRKRSKKTVRRLWGRGKGDFRTGGKRSSATVRGTWWLVEDRCDGTLTRVKTGRVDVRVLRTKKVVKLWKRAGKRYLYLAKAP